MAMKNYSAISEFTLLGLSADPCIQAMLFMLFLLIYLLTLMGNFLMLVITADSQLHTPMYFFLRQLSFLDLCHSSVTAPKMLENLLSERKTIFVESCLAQAFFVFATGGTEACLLAVMVKNKCERDSTLHFCHDGGDIRRDCEQLLKSENHTSQKPNKKQEPQFMEFLALDSGNNLNEPRNVLPDPSDDVS